MGPKRHPAQNRKSGRFTLASARFEAEKHQPKKHYNRSYNLACVAILIACGNGPKIAVRLPTVG